jgi:hypothetical protein
VTDRRARARPPRRAVDLRPVIVTVAAGARWVRFIKTGHRDALGAGLAPSCFSDPILDRGASPRWLPIYLGQSFTLCLQETVLRDRANATPPGPFLISRSELASWDWAQIEVVEDLRVADLREAALTHSRVPTDVVGASDQRLARVWAAAFYRYPEKLDGIVFPSRFRTGDCLALFQTRVTSKLRVSERRALLESPVQLGQACSALDLAIVADPLRGPPK